jgi:hypothetical protein
MKKLSNRASTTNTPTTLLVLGIVLLAVLGLIGCDDNGGYELVPCTTCGDAGGSAGSGGNLNPGGGGGTGGDTNPQPDPTCRSVPSFWDLRSYNGCMTQSDLAGAVRDQNRREFWFEGKAFVENATQKAGELYYMVADGSECGPVTMAAISNSGTIQFVAGSEVDWYLVDAPMAEVIWTKLHGGNAPTYAQVMSGEFASLLVDIFECEVVNPTCALKASIPGGWPTYGGGLVVYQHSGPNAVAEGAFCGHMYVVARSR